MSSTIPNAILVATTEALALMEGGLNMFGKELDANRALTFSLVFHEEGITPEEIRKYALWFLKHRNDFPTPCEFVEVVKYFRPCFHLPDEYEWQIPTLPARQTAALPRPDFCQMARRVCEGAPGALPFRTLPDRGAPASVLVEPSEEEKAETERIRREQIERLKKS